MLAVLRRDSRQPRNRAMTHHAHDPADLQEQLWSAVEKHQIGMLGVLGDSHHFQPMTAFVERDTNEIWFFTYKDTDLAQSAAEQIDGGRAAFIFYSRELQACVDGRLSVQHDPERMEKYWNAHVAAWYPEGKDDPRLTLLRLDCTEAAVWLSEAGPVRYAWEILKANVSHSTPDVGERANINLH
jgi:general stress protein 26